MSTQKCLYDTHFKTLDKSTLQNIYVYEDIVIFPIKYFNLS